MGSKRRQDGQPPGFGSDSIRILDRPRGGFSNAVLLIGIAVIGLIALLSMIDSGGFDPGALLAQPVASKSSSSKKRKPPPLYPPRELPVVVGLVLEEQATQPDGIRAERELRQAIAKMDSKAAAELLAELDTTTVADLLIDQRERDLARILEAAEPSYAAEWVMALRDEIDVRRREAELAASALARIPETPASDLLTETGGGDGTIAEDTADPASDDTSPTDPTGGGAASAPVENGRSTSTQDSLPPGSNIA